MLTGLGERTGLMKIRGWCGLSLIQEDWEAATARTTSELGWELTSVQSRLFVVELEGQFSCGNCSISWRFS